MIPPILRHCRLGPPIFFALLFSLALALAGLAVPARADLAHAGQWTPPANWAQLDHARFAVHMMLLRGDNNPYHSRILWFQGEDTFAPDTTRIFEGGEWLWKQSPDTCRCFAYPVAQFDSASGPSPLNPFPTSGFNPFCAGHTILGNGKALIAGGDDPVFGDYGEIQARIFTNRLDTLWYDPGHMTYRRFYPTVTTLRDGRALVTGGSNWRQHWIWGGLNGNPGSPGGTLSDAMRRFSPIAPGSWDLPAIVPAGSGSVPQRSGHTAVQMEGIPPYGHVIFGGRGSSGVLNDTWLLYRPNDFGSPLLSDAQYSWQPLPIVYDGTLRGRSDHSAVLAFLADTEMVIFGGRGDGTTIYNEVWKFFFNFRDQTFHWSQINNFNGTQPPAARFGHSAIYDETTVNGTLRKRMIVFGGADASSNPTDLTVYELWLNPPNPAIPQWSPMDTVDLDNGGRKPAPRYWATLSPPTAAFEHTYNAVAGKGHVALLFGGKLSTGGCSDTLWGLWLFESGKVGWKMIPGGAPSPAARARHSAVFDTSQSFYDGRLYIYGGQDASGNLVDSKVWALDPWGGPYATWQVWNDLGFSVAGHTAVLELNQEQARLPEVYDPANGWATQGSAYLYEEFFPPSFLVPGGGGGNSRVVNLGLLGQQAYRLDVPPAGQPATETWGALGDTTGYSAATGVQYRPGRILIAGGGDLQYNVSGRTRTLNASLPGSTWQEAGTKLAARLHHNLVLLPTGEVLAVGGNQVGLSGSPVQSTQVWTAGPGDGTGEWSDPTQLAQQPTVRGNHSTAILLPDGRVLSAGGDKDENLLDSDMHMGNIFCPPYLFNAADGTLAARPTFSNSAKPESLGYGKVFTICVPDTAGITRACLIRPGATTHSVDMNQRYVPLAFTPAANPMRLLATSPASPDSAPPGDYMLFLTGKGSNRDVPSIAKWVRVVASGLDSCDVVAPAVASVSANCDPNSVNGWILSWLAPGDDGVVAASGPAAYYDLRLRSVHITSSDWAGASHIPTPAPGPLSTPQSVSVGCSSYRYLRMVTKDDNNNPADEGSNLSNEVVIFPWTTQGFDCVGGGGMFAGSGGAGGFSAAPASGFAGVAGVTGSAIAENSLLPGAHVGAKMLDAWRMTSGLEGVTTSNTVRVRELAGHAAAVDHVRFVALDHAVGVEAVSLNGGYALGTRRAAARVTSGAGTDLTTALASGSIYAAAAGETLSVALGQGAGSAPLVIQAAGTWPCAVDVLAPDGTGGWQSRGRLQPRQGMDLLALAAPGSDVVRVAVIGPVSLQFVGSFALAGGIPTIQTAALVGASDARLGDVSALVSGSDNLSATLVGPDTLTLAFAAPPLATGHVRDYFLVVEATPVTSSTMAQLQPATEALAVPTHFALRQNRPNPFNATTTVWFDLPVGAMVRLQVFDPQGRRVETLANRYFPPGSNAVPWNPAASGTRVGPGIYFYRLEAGAFRAQKKMILLP